MLTLPEIVERTAVPYVAVAEDVTIPFGKAIPAIIGRLFGYLEDNQLRDAGPVFFRYTRVAMPDLHIEFGVPVERPLKADGTMVSGTLPGGRFAEVTYTGPYDNLIRANAVLIGWAEHMGLSFDSRRGENGEHFACRVETYHNGPDDEPDPQKWRTTVAIKLKD